MDSEKAALLPPREREEDIALSSSDIEPTLEQLSQRCQETHAEWQAASRTYQAAWRKTAGGRIFLSTMLAICILPFLFLLVGIVALVATDDEPYNPPRYLSTKVPLDVHIMSKCPDAQDCLHDLILPAMVNVSSHVDFTLSYIGRSTADDGILCPHGQEECLGNMIELCAAEVYPDPKIYLGFTMCLTKDYQNIPHEDLVKECALEHGISFEKLNECMSADDGEGAMDMLRSSVEHSKNVGVQKSCTVRVEDKVWCVRDGGKWTDCEDGHKAKDLVDAVEIARKQRLQMIE